MGDECGICGGYLVDEHCETLKCDHKFHYECIMKSFKKMKQDKYAHPNRCPYCREKSGYLTIVNGLTSLIPKIHYDPSEGKPVYQSTRCSHILTRGNRKGLLCDKKCKIGSVTCRLHCMKSISSNEVKVIKIHTKS